jgi:uncharacterized protein (DUF885 family)
MRARRIAAAAAIAFCAAAAAQEPPRNEQLHALFDREFRNFLDETPEYGTILGIPGYDDRFSDASPAAVARRKAHIAPVIAELRAFDPSKLSKQDRISRDVALDKLELAQSFDALYRDLPFGASDSWMVLSPMFGLQDMLAYVTRATRFATVADYDTFLKRLDAVPALIDQSIARMRAGMRSGWMPPHEAMLRVPGMLAPYAGADVKATPVWKPFEDFPAGIPESARSGLAERGRRILSERVHPAFAKLKAFFESEYLPATRKELAASKLPAGPAYYALLVRQMTTTSMTPDEIHAIGLAEVKRIRAEMDKVMVRSGFKGTREEFLAFLGTDPRFFFKTSEARLAAYRDIAKRADAELPKLFAELPRLPYGIRAMEASEGDNADHYSSGAIDGSRAGFFEANVNNVEKKPSHEMEYTLLHEAVPGHHLQIARAMEIQGLPLFRRIGGYVALQRRLGAVRRKPRLRDGVLQGPLPALRRAQRRDDARLPARDRHGPAFEGMDPRPVDPLLRRQHRVP